jgi:hypothetical protein
MSERHAQAEKVGIKFVGPYLGVMLKTEYLCPIHGEFLQTPNKVQQGLGCQKCGRQSQFASRRLSQAEIENDARAVGLAYVSGYQTLSAKATYVCPVHGVISMHPSAVRRGSLCGKCAGYQKSIDSIHAEARAVNLTLVGPYIGGKFKTEYYCEIHGNLSKTPESVRAGKGCPGCAKHGFNPNRPAHFYAYHIFSRNDEFIGYGITNDIATRENRHTISLSARGMQFERIFTHYFAAGRDALNLESEIMRVFKGFSVNTGVPGFVKEALKIEALHEFLKHCAGVR